MQASIQAVTNSTINSENAVHKENDGAYNAAYNNFISVLEGDVAKTISSKSDAFRGQLFVCQNLNSKYEQAQNENSVLKKALNLVTQSLESEQQSLSQKQNELSAARSQISSDFDMKIFS
ncbi:MAG TPA: hypothetical protein DD429_12035, partial [Clostridiaceae bacterium]|nr:hypothetical protein [Clostridiaceae bacterium]